MKFSIRLLYLYLFSFIGLLICVIGTVQLVDLGLKVYVFGGADRYDVISLKPTRLTPNGETIEMTQEEVDEQKRLQESETNRQRQRQASTALAMILVGAPLYKYHWNLIKKENKNN